MRTSPIIIALALFIGLATADDSKLDTNVYGSMYFHNPPQYNTAKTTGTVIGWIVFCLAIIIVASLIITEMIQRHRSFHNDIAEMKVKMQNMGLDPVEVDAGFKKVLKGLAAVEAGLDHH